MLSKTYSKGHDTLSSGHHHPQKQSLKGLVIFAFCLIACSVVTQNTEAENSIDRSFFLPTDMHFFYSNGNLNELAYDNNEFFDNNSYWLSNFARGLDNDALLLTVKNLKTNSMSSAQRGHNYRWIQNNDIDSHKQSKTFIKKIVTTALKTYWNQWRSQSLDKNSLIPDADGNGRLNWKNNDIEYRVKASGDYVKLMFKMEFY